MLTRKSIPALGFAALLATPLSVLADGFWETTNDEAGSRIVAPRLGAIIKTAPLANANALQPGTVSPDRQYVYLGEEAGWELRPMQFAFRNGRLVHLDDPVGHMSRSADTRPFMEQQRLAFERSGGQ